MGVGREQRSETAGKIGTQAGASAPLSVIAPNDSCDAEEGASYKQGDGRWLGNGAKFESIHGRRLGTVGAGKGDDLGSGCGGEFADDILAAAANRVGRVVIKRNGIGRRRGSAKAGPGAVVVRGVHPPLKFVLLAEGQPADGKSESVVFVSGDGGAEQRLVVGAQTVKRRIARSESGFGKEVPRRLGKSKVAVGGGGRHERICERSEGDAVNGDGGAIHVECGDQCSVSAHIAVAGDVRGSSPSDDRALGPCPR